MSDLYNKYITYFQSVTTIGVMNCAKSLEEAEVLAKEKLKVSDLNYCHFEQTPLELSDTEEWNPEFEIVSEDPTDDGKAIEWTVKMGEGMRNVVAERSGVDTECLTNDHISAFVNDAMKELIKKHE